MKVDLTRTELVWLRAALRIAREDGSLYGGLRRKRDIEARDARFDDIDTKLVTAMVESRR